MTCRKNRRQLIPWLDGELKPERAKELKAWFDSCEEVRQCTNCRELIAQYIDINNAFNKTLRSEFPAFLHNRIIDTIKSRKTYYHQRVIRTRWQTVPAAIAILLSFYLGLMVGFRTFNTNTQTASTTKSTELSSFGENSLVSELYTSGGQE
jgi:anti-sigma factor RsiW